MPCPAPALVERSIVRCSQARRSFQRNKAAGGSGAFARRHRMRTVERAHSARADAIVAAMVQPGLADARSSALWLVISISVVAGAVACEPNTDIVASRNALPD